MKSIKFIPNEEDLRILEALTARTGLSGTALLRVAIRDKALALGVWKPGPADATAPTETEDQRAAG